VGEDSVGEAIIHLPSCGVLGVVPALGALRGLQNSKNNAKKNQRKSVCENYGTRKFHYFREA